MIDTSTTLEQHLPGKDYCCERAGAWQQAGTTARCSLSMMHICLALPLCCLVWWLVLLMASASVMSFCKLLVFQQLGPAFICTFFSSISQTEGLCVLDYSVNVYGCLCTSILGIINNVCMFVLGLQQCYVPVLTVTSVTSSDLTHSLWHAGRSVCLPQCFASIFAGHAAGLAALA